MRVIVKSNAIVHTNKLASVVLLRLPAISIASEVRALASARAFHRNPLIDIAKACSSALAPGNQSPLAKQAIAVNLRFHPLKVAVFFFRRPKASTYEV